MFECKQMFLPVTILTRANSYYSVVLLSLILLLYEREKESLLLYQSCVSYTKEKFLILSDFMK